MSRQPSDVFEASFWVVRRAGDGMFLGGDGEVAALDRATRVAAPLAREVAAGRGPSWEAVPVSLRLEAHPEEVTPGAVTPEAGGGPPAPGTLSFYTLADDGGEYLLSSPVPLDWPLDAITAVRLAGVESAAELGFPVYKLADVLRFLRTLRPGVEVVRAPRYFHVQSGSENWRSDDPT